VRHQNCIASCVVGLWIGSCLLTARADEADASKGPKVGERVTDFELPMVGSDEYVTLSEEYEQGSVVVVILRGHPGYQCPICTSQMATLRNRAKALAKEAHRVILVYPGEAKALKRNAERFMGSRKLPSPLLIVRDDDMKLVEQWGLRWNARSETAYPATFVIDRNGRIRWKRVSESHAGRSTVEEILKQLRKL
jgi:peroxiredoxin Q/BCP